MKNFYRLIQGDCIQVLKGLDENSIDCAVTDPPYGIAFMQKDWDRALPPKEAFKEMFRVLKPGALAFVMSSPRQDMLWRMMSMLEGVGFKLRQSPIYWTYACVSEDTEVLTKEGWERWRNTRTFKDKEILVYNSESDGFQWEIPTKWHSYKIEDTCCRIKSDFTDQLVTRNHRVAVEREGKILFRYAKDIIEEVRVPYLENMSVLQTTISNLSRMVTKGKEPWKVLLNKLSPKSEYTQVSPSKWQTHSPYVRRTETKTTRGNVGREELGVERWSHLFQDSRQLQGSQICEMPQRIYGDGSKGRLHYGTSAISCQTVRKTSEKDGSSSPYKSRSNRQPTRKFGFVSKQQTSQVTGKRTSYKTTLATITRERYNGIVYCPTVSTGCFVARRKGKIFITGNSGFPKAYDVSLGIDRKIIREEFIEEFDQKPTKEEMKELLEKKRKIIEINQKFRSKVKAEIERGQSNINKNMQLLGLTNSQAGYQNPNEVGLIKESYSPLAKKWVGWKSQTGLKPAVEVILMVNKPRSERTIVDNVLKHGTGAMNVDETRIPFKNPNDKDSYRTDGRGYASIDETNVKGNYRPKQYYKNQKGFTSQTPRGRFPANLLVSDDVLDTGKIHKKGGSIRNSKPRQNIIYGEDKRPRQDWDSYGDSGGFSRFFSLDSWWTEQVKKLPLDIQKTFPFMDVPKASKSERDKGLEKFPLKKQRYQDGRSRSHEIFEIEGSGRKTKTVNRNFHPTVKPLKLMSYLVTLGCPPGGVILDPFLGSGTTMLAAVLMNKSCMGIEISKEYCEIAKARCFNRNLLTTYTFEYSFEIFK